MSVATVINTFIQTFAKKVGAASVFEVKFIDGELCIEQTSKPGEARKSLIKIPDAGEYVLNTDEGDVEIGKHNVYVFKVNTKKDFEAYGVIVRKTETSIAPAPATAVLPMVPGYMLAGAGCSEFEGVKI